MGTGGAVSGAKVTAAGVFAGAGVALGFGAIGALFRMF